MVFVHTSDDAQSDLHAKFSALDELNRNLMIGYKHGT